MLKMLDLVEPIKTLIIRTLKWNSKNRGWSLDPLHSVEDTVPLSLGLQPGISNPNRIQPALLSCSVDELALSLKQELSRPENVEVKGVICVAVVDNENLAISLRLLEKSDAPAMPPILSPIRLADPRSTMGKEHCNSVKAASTGVVVTVPELFKRVIITELYLFGSAQMRS